jgi:predicted AAA+ superfamily ATPase
MIRFAHQSLESWSSRTSRKPLVVRGARQVGKTYLIRDFAKRSGFKLIEYNFDLQPEKSSLFTKSPVESLKNLQADLGFRPQSGKHLLFLDEIQAAPELFATLRYWYEDCPEFHLIVAGSLLDFVLEEHEFSMPVGRIEYLYLAPISFDEYLLASDELNFYEYLCEWNIHSSIPEALHLKGLEFFKYYLAIGGMPVAIEEWHNTGSISDVQRHQQSILQSYQDDFAKYKNKVNTARLKKVFQAMPRQIGKKVKYAHLDPNSKAADVRSCLDMLNLARVIHLVHHSSANGVPLSAEINDRDFKSIFIDVGLLNSMMNVNWNEILLSKNPLLVHQGLQCEQFVGQNLLYLQEDYRKPELFYWNREKKNSSAEVDFLIQSNSDIIPVEVKAGKTGRLKSLGIFVETKQSKIALRFNNDLPSKVEFFEKELISIPFYLIGQVKRMMS